MSAFPAVATVIGVSKEVVESGPLLATLAIDPSVMATTAPPPPPPTSEEIDIKTGDPVTQAVVDNIIGKLPTKKEQVKVKCEVCNVTVSCQAVLDRHLAGAKHARKVKGKELIKEIENSSTVLFVDPLSTQNGLASKMAEYNCKICNVILNSSQQLKNHLAGSKHKNKADTNKSNVISVPIDSSGGKGVVKVDIGPNKLYCAACNVHVNSDLQLHQHIISPKHANKVNGRPQGPKINRGIPYSRRTTTGGNNNFASYYNNSRAGNSGWRGSNSNFGLQGSWSQNKPPINKSFIPGGTLY